MINSTTAIHWFRRDLRISDNPALFAAIGRSRSIVPIFILSAWKNEHNWTGSPRQEFLCGCLQELSENLAQLGARLIIRQGRADLELARVIDETGAKAVYFNRDPDPFGRAMESRIREMAQSRGVESHEYKDSTLHERDEILNASGQPYRIFTPYSKSWLKAYKTAPAKRPGGQHLNLTTPTNLPSLPLPTLKTWNLGSSKEIPAPGEKAGRERLDAFLSGPIFQYAATRDIPSRGGTSRLSADLRFGTLSVREVYDRCVRLLMEPMEAMQRKSIHAFINELIWREFYIQVLWHWPEVLEFEFSPKYRSLCWSRDDSAFERWREGTTGFPIVDAAMRQLNATGFMHNRLRMITAMFLTKDLHIDWRLGEQYFMQRLGDGEIASNNGGWQWSAGTGADAAPYFRIQNPWSQTKRFDPEGIFIRSWLPELRDVETGRLTVPPSDAKPVVTGYPVPMVDHKRERDVTLSMMSL